MGMKGTCEVEIGVWCEDLHCMGKDGIGGHGDRGLGMK